MVSTNFPILLKWLQRQLTKGDHSIPQETNPVKEVESNPCGTEGLDVTVIHAKMARFSLMIFFVTPLCTHMAISQPCHSVIRGPALVTSFWTTASLQHTRNSRGHRVLPCGMVFERSDHSLGDRMRNTQGSSGSLLNLDVSVDLLSSPYYSGTST